MAAVVEDVVDDEPTVVGLFLPLADVDMGIGEEAVVLVHEALHALAYSCSVDGCCDLGLADIQDVEREGGDVGIDDDDTSGGGAHEVLQGYTGRVEITLEEHHLGRRRGGSDEEVELLLLLGLRVLDACHAQRLLIEPSVHLTLHGEQLLVH